MKTPTLLIDNGHGKNTAGKRSPDGRLMEWEFARKVAQKCAELAPQYGLKAVILVPEERDVALSTRAARANDYIKQHPSEHCALVSIHGNAAGDGSSWMAARGWEAWTTIGKNNSDTLADRLYYHATLIFPVGTRLRTDKSDGDLDKEKDFTIIKKANCPAVLTENFFFDNKEDCDFMLSEDGIDMIARVHLAASQDYFRVLYS